MNASAQSSQVPGHNAGGLSGLHTQGIATFTRVTGQLSLALDTVPEAAVNTAEGLLVDWFGRWDAAGKAQVSDDVRRGHGPRRSLKAFSNRTDDIALSALANSKSRAEQPDGHNFGIERLPSSRPSPSSAGSPPPRCGPPAVDSPVSSRHSDRRLPTAAVPAGGLAVKGLITGGPPGHDRSRNQPGTVSICRQCAGRRRAPSSGMEDVL